MLPLDANWAQRLTDIQWPTKNLPEVIGSNSTTLRSLLREYLFITLFQACAESLSSENATRLAAMQRADKNIDELLATLQDPKTGFTASAKAASTKNSSMSFPASKGFETLR